MALYWVALDSCPIYEQLQLEEALLRTDENSYCIVNKGSPPSIVMGISGKKRELVDELAAKEKSIPLIRRYSGGGCVVVDEDTLFISFIIGKEFYTAPLYPESIHRWAEDLYLSSWKIPGFALRENDYVIQEKKCGGNAQYLKKDRFVHHTTFLWKYCPTKMSLLLHPAKEPSYRKKRDHLDFLQPLHSHAKSVDYLIDAMKNELDKRFHLQEKKVEELHAFLDLPHRKSVTLV